MFGIILEIGGNASLLLSTFNRKHTSMKENLLPLNTSVYILHINHRPGIGTTLNLDHRLHKPQLVDRLWHEHIRLLPSSHMLLITVEPI